MAKGPRPPVSEGSPEPLGVSLTATGINVAVWSAHAEAIEVCLFDDAGDAEIARIALPCRRGPVFHGHIEGVVAGARYGLRAHGPFAPDLGHRFNPDKLLVDPYALQIDRPFVLHPAMFAHDLADSAPFMPKGIIAAPMTPPAPPPPAIPWSRSVIYELHVRGFTRTHPDIPEALRGTFAALAHPAAIGHLRGLGVTTVELMPASAWIDERHLPPLWLSNYWGYNPVAYLAPDPRLAPGGWAEVRAAVDALAAAGIETLLDVVFNHSGEGDALGPTLSMRGLDNAAYYRLDPADPARYLNEAGTGNTLALNQAPALRLTMDALRAWRRLGGVAGFRFDLAPLLGRMQTGFDPAAPLLAAIDQDPELRGLKLIAEPWDIGAGGYQLGRFPPAWGEWNDRFRDTARDFWRGDHVSLGDLARRLAGSQDIFAGRRPSRSVNFVVSHDGFTLADLVAHENKHNSANGEANRDGHDHNLSWNNGVEGPSDDPAIRAARLADQRAMLATLLLSRGTPMLAMGSDMAHSQGGNNNAYAQDNAIGWLNWAAADTGLMAFTARLIAIRADHAALRADCFLAGASTAGGAYPDVEWRAPDGAPLSAEAWDDPAGETLVMVLAESDGGRLDRVAVAVHRGAAPTQLTLPEPRDGHAWTLLADSADPERGGVIEEADQPIFARSVTIFAEEPAPNRRPTGVDDKVLERLAAAAGIAPEWWDVEGAGHRVSPDSQKALLAAMSLAADTTGQAVESLAGLARDRDRRALPHALVSVADEPVTLRLAVEDGGAPTRTWLTIRAEDGSTRRLRADGIEVNLPLLDHGRYTVTQEDVPDLACHLIIAPRACHAPEVLKDGGRVWGLATQIYGVRRQGDQGIGDFTTLGALGEAAAERGGAILGFNPLHALFNDRPDLASPYYPSDRRFLDPIYLDLERVAFAGSFRDRAAQLSALPAIDHARVRALKTRALEASFAHGQADPRLDAFIVAGGERLRRFALFQAVAESRPGEAWRNWPAGLHDPDGPAARAFATAHFQRLRFHQYLQWLCENQLSDAARRVSGLSLGLCRDLAIGAAPDGAEIWAEAALVARGVSIGAPPDPLGPQGQVWGLPPFDPRRLRADGYRGVSALLAANMRHAGALRIDHVMGLARQFWVPDGADGSEGAYVAFPFDDLLGVVALESVQAGCLVIGEDLGTVPEGFREALSAVGALSYRVLPFERDEGGFRPPSACPHKAWACVDTHDLPPLAGWWEGVDIAERLDLGLITPAEAEEARAARVRDKVELIEALTEAELCGGIDPASALDAELAAAIHAFIARSGAALAIAQVEDLAGERIAVNLPGTDRERPNWRLRLGVSLETLFEGSLAKAVIGAMRRT